MKALITSIASCLIVLALVTALDFLWAWILELLWNWLVPLLFHGPAITYWEAFGLILLLTLIGGFFRSASSSSSK